MGEPEVLHPGTAADAAGLASARVPAGGAKRVLPASEMTAADRAAYESWCALCGYEPRADGS